MIKGQTPHCTASRVAGSILHAIPITDLMQIKMVHSWLFGGLRCVTNLNPLKSGTPNAYVIEQ